MKSDVKRDATYERTDCAKYQYDIVARARDLVTSAQYIVKYINLAAVKPYVDYTQSVFRLFIGVARCVECLI